MSAKNNLGKQFDELEDIYKVPTRFFYDHVNRHDDPHSLISRVVKETKSHVHVHLTDTQLNHLYNDASYYASGTKDMPGMGGVTSSAKATIKALDKQTDEIEE